VGTGFDFKLASSGATSATVIPGQTGYFNFTLTPLGAASGTVNYQCGTLPTNALCLFNPAQQPSLPANVQGNVTLAVATGGSTGTSGAGPSRGLAAAAVFASILLLLPFPRAASGVTSAASPPCCSSWSLSYSELPVAPVPVALAAQVARLTRADSPRPEPT
jgi:hypothetical protein